MSAASEASGTGLVSSSTTHTPLTWGDPSHRAALVEFRRGVRVSRMQRGVKCAADLLQTVSQTSGHRYRTLFVTLTYRPEVSWSPSHIREFFTRLRNRWTRKGETLRYVWVMELTKAGVPHYHIIFWVRASLRLPAPDRAGLWPHGWSQVQRARSPVGYLVNYAAKADAMSAPFPRGARIFGVGGADREVRAEKRWRLLPAYVRARFNASDGVKRARGGGWLSVVTGEWLRAATLAFFEGRIVAIPPSGGDEVFA